MSKQKVSEELMNKHELVNGPFLFTKLENRSEEVWRISFKDGKELPVSFVLKNYGGKPEERNGFSGWRLVSAGPFGGGWDNFDMAIERATIWLIKYLKEEVEQIKRQCEEKLEYLKSCESDLI